MDISHYNALLSVFVDNELDFSPTDFLEEIRSTNLKPTRATFQKLVQHYCQRGEVENAKVIIEKLASVNISLNEEIYAAQIIGHARNG